MPAPRSPAEAVQPRVRLREESPSAPVPEALGPAPRPATPGASPGAPPAVAAPTSVDASFGIEAPRGPWPALRRRPPPSPPENEVRPREPAGPWDASSADSKAGAVDASPRRSSAVHHGADAPRKSAWRELNVGRREVLAGAIPAPEPQRDATGGPGNESEASMEAARGERRVHLETPASSKGPEAAPRARERIALPRASSPHRSIDVRIGRIEIRATTSRPAPTKRRPQPRGFDDYYLQRSFSGGGLRP